MSQSLRKGWLFLFLSKKSKVEIWKSKVKIRKPRRTNQGQQTITMQLFIIRDTEVIS